MSRRVHVALLLLAAVGCDTGLDQRLALIDEPRVLAVTAEAAEARPGDQVSYAALVVAPDGAVGALPEWAYCTAAKPPTEDNAVAVGCLGDQVAALGQSLTVTAALPDDGCLKHGPDTAEEGARPRDPDPSGGYYQPIRITVDADGTELVAFGLSRITCNLPNAPAAETNRYRNEYQANVNPALLPLALTVDGAPVAADAVPAGATVELRAAWTAADAEDYLYYDAQAQRLITRREAMRLAWFTTAGGLAVDASAVAEDDPATEVTTTWTAPDAPGPAWLWLVLHDSRGGLATQAIAVDIR